MQIPGPHSDLWNQDLHFHEVSQMMQVHVIIWELTYSFHPKHVYLQRKIVWISIQIREKPCWLSKNVWETRDEGVLLVKLRQGASSLQRPVCTTEPLNTSRPLPGLRRGQTIWETVAIVSARASLQSRPPRLWNMPSVGRGLHSSLALTHVVLAMFHNCSLGTNVGIRV